jgi:hypothetical protein
MVKIKKNDKNMLNKERENVRGKNHGITHENEPKHKKRLNKQNTFMHALQRMDDKKISRKGVVCEKKGNLLGIRGTNKMEKLTQLAFCRVKLLKDGYVKNGVESIYNIHL